MNFKSPNLENVFDFFIPLFAKLTDIQYIEFKIDSKEISQITVNGKPIHSYYDHTTRSLIYQIENIQTNISMYKTRFESNPEYSSIYQNVESKIKDLQNSSQNIHDYLKSEQKDHPITNILNSVVFIHENMINFITSSELKFEKGLFEFLNSKLYEVFIKIEPSNILMFKKSDHRLHQNPLSNKYDVVDLMTVDQLTTKKD